MENLNIEEFNPKKVELIELADSCKDLVIKGVDDIDGYGLVNAKRKELKNARVQITKIGKSLRDNAIKFQKEVIAREKEFVGIVAPVEKKLEDMINDIDLEKEKIKRAELLPERKEKLAKINITVSDEELLEMNDLQFHTFLNEKTTEFLAEKERLLEEQRLKEEEEKAKREAEKAEIERQVKLKKEAEEKEAQRLKELEEAKERATKLAILKAEKEKEEAIQAEKEASLKREQAIRDEQEARERARIQRELEEKMAKEKAEAEERARQEAIDKDKKWKEFLAQSGWTKEKENDFYILQNGNTRIIYKKVGEITI